MAFAAADVPLEFPVRSPATDNADRGATVPHVTTTLNPHARTTAIRALQTSIEDDLHHIASDLNNWFTGDRTALREARATLTALRDHLDTLEQLGPPTRRDDH